MSSWLIPYYFVNLLIRRSWASISFFFHLMCCFVINIDDYVSGYLVLLLFDSHWFLSDFSCFFMILLNCLFVILFSYLLWSISSNYVQFSVFFLWYCSIISFWSCSVISLWLFLNKIETWLLLIKLHKEIIDKNCVNLRDTRIC